MFLFYRRVYISGKDRYDSKEKTTALNHDDIADGRIVSSRHLVSERCAELSELEYALIMTSNAFNKWMVRCMTAAGEPDMGPLMFRFCTT